MARADLVGIWTRYVEIAGRLSADKTVRDVGAACWALAARPFAGRARDDVRAGVRSIESGSLVAFYRVDGAGSAEVLRVLDRRQDVDEGPMPQGDSSLTPA
jgi:plasmid stabilization system protein ParE